MTRRQDAIYIFILMVKTVANMSVNVIDDMIRIYSDKIFQLQEQRNKLTGSKLYRLGATKKIW